MIRHAALPVPILAVIPVIAAAMIPVRPERQKTIPAPMLQQPNAGQPVVTVKTALPAVLLTPVLMPELRNVVPVITVPIPAVPVRSPCLVLGMKTKSAYLQQNAEPAAMNVNIIPIVP